MYDSYHNDEKCRYYFFVEGETAARNWYRVNADAGDIVPLFLKNGTTNNNF